MPTTITAATAARTCPAPDCGNLIPPGDRLRILCDVCWGQTPVALRTRFNAAFSKPDLRRAARDILRHHRT